MSILARELGISWTDAGLVVLVATVVYVFTVMASRLFGQRQFATLSSYDMVFTFAIGSVIGRVVLVRTSLVAAILGLVTLFSLHALTGRLHHRVSAAHRVIQNSPLLLVAHGEVQDDILRVAHVSRNELHQALRESGHPGFGGLLGVVLEPTGDFSILTDDQDIDPAVIDDVVGSERLEDVGSR